MQKDLILNKQHTDVHFKLPNQTASTNTRQTSTAAAANCPAARLEENGGLTRPMTSTAQPTHGLSPSVMPKSAPSVSGCVTRLGLDRFGPASSAHRTRPGSTRGAAPPAATVASVIHGTENTTPSAAASASQASILGLPSPRPKRSTVNCQSRPAQRPLATAPSSVLRRVRLPSGSTWSRLASARLICPVQAPASSVPRRAPSVAQSGASLA